MVDGIDAPYNYGEWTNNDEPGIKSRSKRIHDKILYDPDDGKNKS